MGPAALMFTDIEGSVSLWERLGHAFAEALALHNDIIRSAVREHGGREIGFHGDGFLFAFDRPGDAITCGLAIQSGVAEAPWPVGAEELRVRVGINVGEVALVDGEYVGPTVNLAARIIDAACGGQTLVSEAGAEQARDAIEGRAKLVDLGLRQLRGLRDATRIFLAVPVCEPVPEFVPLRTLDILPTNLPAEVDEFVGRERELAEVEALLSQPAVRLLTITGVGGVGKTRLLTRIGMDKLGGFRDGVWLVELTDLREPERLAFTIASALRVPLGANVPDPTAALADSLARKELLLLLDNFEHVLEAAEVPYELLQRAPGLQCIVTSRERLRVPGEHLFELLPMVVPDPGEPWEQQRSADSVQLFCSRAAQARSRPLADRELRAAVGVCRGVDGLPLAIELAAARLSDMTPAEVLESLRDRLSVLQADTRGVPRRMRSIRAALEWSHDLLSAAEAVTFAELSVFLGGFFPEAAEAVCSGRDVAQVLRGLRDKSLLQAETRLERTRYFMLPLVRDYALARLGDGLAARQDKAARYFAEFAQGLDLRGGQQARDLQKLAVELDNVGATLRWAEGHGEGEMLRDVVWAVWPIFQLAGAGSECVRWLEAAVQACRDMGDRRGLAHLLIRTAVAHKLLGDVPRALSLLDESLELSGRSGFEGAALWGQMERGSLLSMLGEHSRAKELFERCLQSYRRAADQWGVAECLRSLGRLACSRGEHQAAEQRLQEALALEDPESQPWGVTNSLYELGRVRLAVRDVPGAVSALQESVTLCRRIGDKPGLVLRLRGYAEAAARAGKSTAAGEACQEALIVARRYAPHLADDVEECLREVSG